ncbi:unnamed protein product, partial [Brassica oleracea]
VHNFSYITFIGIQMTFKPKKTRETWRDMEFVDHVPVMVLRLLTVTMVASMYLELVKEDNYLLKTFKVMLSNYVYTNIYS